MERVKVGKFLKLKQTCLSVEYFSVPSVGMLAKTHVSWVGLPQYWQ